MLEPECLQAQSSRSRASLVIDWALLEAYVAVGQHQKVAVNVVNK